MHPFFLAMGPAFKSSFIKETINSVDVYPLMCKILGLKAAPNDGSLENVKSLLKVTHKEKQPNVGQGITSVTTATVLCKKLPLCFVTVVY